MKIHEETGVLLPDCFWKGRLHLKPNILFQTYGFSSWKVGLHSDIWIKYEFLLNQINQRNIFRDFTQTTWFLITSVYQNYFSLFLLLYLTFLGGGRSTFLCCQKRSDQNKAQQICMRLDDFLRPGRVTRLATFTFGTVPATVPTSNWRLFFLIQVALGNTTTFIQEK